MSVVIETTIGDITVDLFTEERPIACLNFLKLCRLKYYNYNLFHTIEPGFIAQTGDPTGKGDGGSSIFGLVEGSHKRFFESENLPKIYHTSAGLLSLVSAGKNLVASQFFFTLDDNLTSLDGVHCVIGEVVEGHDTLLKLNEAIVDESFRPFQDIRITHTVILDDPFPDPRGFQVPARSPSPTADRLQNGRIAADEDIDDTDGKTIAEIQEMLAEREAKARATILEIVGDLPDAECAPPENVLFVCKLNPVTTDDDLEIIFSRFGKVKNCEVIRDRKTGDSLQYAFVEFEDQKSCEAAYFKMDNVLIDDRRIHVDFSQSVAKVKWRGKGRGVEGSQGRLDFNNLREDKKNDRVRNGRENSDRERSRMTSEERRKAREERHRAQEKRERTRSRSLDRNRRRQVDTSREQRRDTNRERRRPESRERRPDLQDKRRDDYFERNRNEQKRRNSRERQWENNRERGQIDRRRGDSPERRNESLILKRQQNSPEYRRAGSRERRVADFRGRRRENSLEQHRAGSRERRRQNSMERNRRSSKEHRRGDLRKDKRNSSVEARKSNSRERRLVNSRHDNRDQRRRSVENRRRSRSPIKRRNEKEVSPKHQREVERMRRKNEDAKKARRATSSEDSTDDSSTSIDSVDSESSSSSSDSTDSSSSSEELKRKKKNSKSKAKKKKSSNKKKSKKHRK